MNPEEESLYAEMRAAIRGDQERAAKRAAQRTEQSGSPPQPVPTPEPPAAEEEEQVSGLRRFFGSRREPS